MKRSLPALLLLLAACASITPSKNPEWDAVPAPILSAFCSRVRGEGLSREAQMLLVKKTQPLISASSIRALGEAFYRQGDSAMIAATLNNMLKPIPLTITADGTCSWRAIDTIDARRDHEMLVVQLSTPFVNPFARSEAGLFARMSVGGQAPQWYWIPVAERNGQWAIGTVLPLDLHEE